MAVEEFSSNQMLRKSSIAYGLTLTAEETAEQTASLDVLWTVTHGTISLGPKWGSDRSRKNETITNIAERVADSKTALCEGDPERLAWKYPITGEIGVREVIRRYVEVNGIAPTDAKGGFKQTLTFRLKFGGSLKPSFEIVKNVDPTFKGPLEFKADREDKHELIITMAPEQRPPPDGAVNVYITNLEDLQDGKPLEGRKRSVPATPRVDRSSPRGGATATQQQLLDSIDRTQQRQRFREDIREELRE